MAAQNGRVAGVALALALLAAAFETAGAQKADVGPWRGGRATSYGNEPWLWSIHEGSCGYSYIWPDEGHGWDVGAMPDVHPDYPGSCGRCYEVACDPTLFQDNFGNAIDRRHVCYDSAQSTVIHIVDTCPCNYPANFYMNKRWCCGDMDHLDLSVWAFEKLANTKWGVIGIKYRQVPCTHMPAIPAPAPANPFPGVPPPPGAVRPTTPRFIGPSLVAGDAQEVTVATIGGIKPVFDGGVVDGWVETSWESKEVKKSSKDPKTALCYSLSPGGAFAVQTDEPFFAGQVSLEFWVKTDKGVPDVNINIAGPMGSCRNVKLQDMNMAADSRDGYAKFDIYLGLFDRADEYTVVAFAAEFKGCGGNSAVELNQLMFMNDLPEESQEICFSNVRLVG